MFTLGTCSQAITRTTLRHLPSRKFLLQMRGTIHPKIFTPNEHDGLFVWFLCLWLVRGRLYILRLVRKGWSPGYCGLFKRIESCEHNRYNFILSLFFTFITGLWGRSMGAITAVMHADRDPSIAGMILDSPFSTLRSVAEELAK